MRGAVAITLPKMVLLLFTFYTQTAEVLWSVLGCNAAFVALFFAREALRAWAVWAQGFGQSWDDWLRPLGKDPSGLLFGEPTRERE